MKRTLSIILTLLMLLSLVPLSASAAADIPTFTQTPEIVYAWEDTNDYGTRVYCEILNSTEITDLARQAETIGWNVWREEHDVNNVRFGLQIAYSFDGGASWRNAFGEDVMGNDWDPVMYAPDVPGDYPDDFVSMPFNRFDAGCYCLYQDADVLNLQSVYTEYSDYSRADLNKKAAYLSQGKAFYVGNGEAEPNYLGYAVDFNKNTLLMKARYVIFYNNYDIAVRTCGEWGNTFKFNNAVTPESAGFDIPSHKKYNTPGFELLTVYENDSGEQSFLFGITPDKALSRLFTEHRALYNFSDELVYKTYGDYTLYNVDYKLEMRLNGGEWKSWCEYSNDNIFFWYDDWQIKGSVEHLFGVTPKASDKIEVRLHFIPSTGAAEDENYCLTPTAQTFAYTDYTEPVRIPMNGLYYINYHCNNGSFPYGTEQLTQFGKNDTKVIDLTDENYIPEKYGYKFGGWYSDEDFKTKVTSIDTSVKCDTTVYAKWLGDEYTITYDLDGIDAYNPNPEMYTPYMDDIELSPAEYSGMKFIGWSYKKGGDTVTVIDTAQKKNLTLYANWDTPTFTVTYKLDGGKNAASNPEKVKADKDGNTTAYFAAPEKTGYIFDGWFTDKDFKAPLSEENGKWFARITENTTLYAKWIKGRWDIDYVVPDALKGIYNPNPENYTYGDTVKLEKLSTPGYTFDGWFTDAKLSVKAASPAVKSTDTGKKTFWAKFTEKSCKITYNIDVKNASNYFKNENPAERLYSKGVVLKELTPVAPVYKFLGWYNNVNFDGDPVKEIIAGTEKNVQLYAKLFKCSWGDINFDGTVTAADARLALRQSVSLENLSAEQIAWGNVDKPGDGKLTAADARLILRLSVSLDTVAGLKLPEFPPELA